MIESIIVTISMLFLSAIFSGIEIAFISSNKFHLEIKSYKSLQNKILSKLISTPDDFISSLLICNNITLVVYSIYFSDIILNTFFLYYKNEPLPIYILLFQTIIATVIVFFLAEFIPKIIFLKSPFKMINIFIIPTYIFHYIITILGINTLIKFFVRFFSKLFLKKEIKEFKINLGKIEFNNLINEQIEYIYDKVNPLKNEIEIIQNTLAFSESRIKNCFIPRNEIKAVDINIPVSDLIKMFSDTGLSKIIIYRKSIDDILGYVHVNEIFKKIKDIKSILRSIDFFPESLSLYDGMNKLIQTKKSIAIVINEYGQVSGLVTLEDILEKLFGDIEDEFDKKKDDYLTQVKVNEKEFIFSSRLEIDYINEKFNLKLPDSNNYETLNGLFLHYNENIPQKGDVIIISDIFKFVVEDVADNKVNTLRLNILD